MNDDKTTLNEATRAEILAAMAADDEDEFEETGTSETSFGVDGNARMATIRVGDKSVQVPTLAYVTSLENIIRAQSRELKKHERQFARISAALRNQRMTSNQQNNELNTVWQELDSKIDRRTDF